MSRLDIELGVVGAEVRGDLLGTLCFVIAALVKADGERFDRPRALRLHERDHGRGIDPAGQECAERHVCNHSQADGIAQERVETLDRLVWLRRRVVAPLPSDRNAAQIPETFWRWRDAFAQRQDMPGGSFRASR